jgi:hypothetical protein
MSRQKLLSQLNFAKELSAKFKNHPKVKMSRPSFMTPELQKSTEGMKKHDKNAVVTPDPL